MNNLSCHYCDALVDGNDSECNQCGAALGKIKKNKPFLCFLLIAGSCFALFTLWVGYTLFL